MCCKNKRQRGAESKKKSYREMDTTSDSDSNSDEVGQKCKLKKIKTSNKSASVSPAAAVALKPVTGIAKSAINNNQMTKVIKPMPAKISGGSSKPETSLSAKLLDIATRTLTENVRNLDNVAPNNGVGNKDDIVCTPDLFNFLNENLQLTLSGRPIDQGIPSATAFTAPTGPTHAAPTASASLVRLAEATASIRQSAAQNPSRPPPLHIRSTQTGSSQPLPTLPQQARRPYNMSLVQQQQLARAHQNAVNAAAAANATSPIYHTINGFRIDLNSAAQQTTYRLPNGKVIQVKKQTPVNANAANSNVQQRNNATQIRPRPPSMAPIRGRTLQSHALPIRPNLIRAPLRHPQPAHQRIPRHPATAAYQPNHQMQRTDVGNNVTAQQMPVHPAGPAPIPVTPLSNGLPPLLAQLRKYPNTPSGNAQRQLERQIYGGQEICYHIVSKLNTLMNSNAYKSVRSMNDIKELHIHLSYLLTYTIGRFKTMQDKCLEDMRAMGFSNDAASLHSGQVIDKYGSDCEEDELAIVEPQHATISIDDSDDDDDSSAGKRQASTGLKVTKTEMPDSESDALLASDCGNQSETSAEDAPMFDLTSLLEPQVILDSEETAEKDALPDVTLACEPGVSTVQATATVTTTSDVEAGGSTTIIDNVDDDEFEIPMPPPLSPPPIDISSDMKLQVQPVVVLERCDVDRTSKKGIDPESDDEEMVDLLVVVQENNSESNTVNETDDQQSITTTASDVKKTNSVDVVNEANAIDVVSGSETPADLIAQEDEIPDVDTNKMSDNITDGRAAADADVPDANSLGMVEPLLMVTADQLQVDYIPTDTVASVLNDDVEHQLENISSPDTFEDYSKNGIDVNTVVDDNKATSDVFAEAINDLLGGSEHFPDMDHI